VDREQRRALLDPLTQLWNRAALRRFHEREHAWPMNRACAWG
jgi:GGDEF domain-containing protein